MEIHRLELATADKLNPERCFECGQCFRWNRAETGAYYGVAYNYPAKVFEDKGSIYIQSAAPDELWLRYFDMELDYAKASEFDCGEYLRECVDFGRGIRILRQEPWEALCSFIISQCNNIPRIKGIVERLCSMYGDRVEFEGREFFTFPSAERLSGLTEEELAPLRSGYRAAYILGAARETASGDLNFDSLEGLSWTDAKKRILALNGVGEKVANCFILFGLHRMEAFPVDVWMKRALKEHFPPDFKPESLGEFAGLAQQYIFYRARSEGKNE